MNGDAIVQRELAKGERVLWTGRPDPKRLAELSKGGVFMGALTIFLGLFFFWMWLVVSDWLLVLLGVVFLGMGIWQMGMPSRTQKMAANIIYAVTDRRILVILEATKRNVGSYDPTTIGNLELSVNPNGSGDVIFAREYYRVLLNGVPVTRERKIGFYGVPDAREVERLIRENLKQN